MQALRRIGRRELALSAAIASAAFAVVGTVTALWPNSLFIRMTPAGGFETFLLAVQAVLGGLYLGIDRPRCAAAPAGAGGALGFIGVACPVCNKVLLLVFGSTLLLEYFEPVRLYVGVAGTALLAYALWRKLARGACPPVRSPGPA